jgi:hypothetical protein
MENEKWKTSEHLTNLINDSVGIRVLAGFFFGIDFLSIDADLENTTAHRHKRELTDVLFELQQLLRQTDGTRFIVSNTAVFDFDVHWHFAVQRRS